MVKTSRHGFCPRSSVLLLATVVDVGRGATRRPFLLTIDSTVPDEREYLSYALQFPDGCPGFWQGFTPWLQHSMLKILLCSPSHVVAGLWHWPPQNTSLVAHEHEQVASLKVCPPEHWANTHTPLHSWVPAGHSQAQVVGLRCSPGAHGVKQRLL